VVAAARPRDPAAHHPGRPLGRGSQLISTEFRTLDAVPSTLAPIGYARGDDEIDVDVSDLLQEHYHGPLRVPRLLTLYYRVKPLLPRRLQIAMRRLHARRVRRRHEAEGAFPRWPIEPVLVERFDQHLRQRLRATDADAVPFVALWPGRHRFAYILTHDVEGPRGAANIERLLAIERRHGMVSSWNLVVEDYTVDEAVLAAIAAAGGEIGLHGLTHDGRLFESRASFERQLPEIHRRLEALGAEGFRSPATRRNAAWMPELRAGYDSSFPDTDPFEPQPGGCCSILPYFLEDTVELPITLVQDHTLFEILREDDIGLWRDKARWIARHSGLVTVLVHPDYLVDDARLRRYDELLSFLRQLDGGWHALPRDAARWWRRRAALDAALARGEQLDAERLATAGASVAWAHERDGEIAIDVGGRP
jgi:peptidoglycan/xylan/chitin deacetylase (PgdA/CDA1 family)